MRRFRKIDYVEVMPNPLVIGDSSSADALGYLGAREFGGSWLNANQQAVMLLMRFGINYTHARALGHAIAFLICTAAKKGKVEAANIEWYEQKGKELREKEEL